MIVYRAAIGIACATGFVLVWINAAAGIIGDGPVNLLYVGVLAVGFVGAVIARFQPRGLALALFATAVAQMLVPVIALAIWKAGWQDLLTDPNSPNPPFDPGIAPVLGLNAVFAALWLVSALLFRRAGRITTDTVP
jgi:xanthine/uracil permease